MRLKTSGLLILSLLSLPALAETQARLAMTQSEFVSSDYHLTDKKDFQFFSAGLDTLAQVRREDEIENSLQAQVRGLVSPGVSVLSYMNISQLYWKQDILAVGRKKTRWSLLDDEAQLGLYQPLFRWNPLQPESQGLTGVFLHLQGKTNDMPVGMVLYGSTLFIPDQGTGYEVKSGAFERSNPYFQAPPQQANINGQTDSVSYTVQKPNTQDVVFNRSLGAKVYLGEENTGFFSQLAYANKPSNQLALALQGAVNPNNTVELNILPAVYYHTLISGDLKYSWRNVGLGLSTIHEKTEDPTYSSEWSYIHFSDSDVVSPFLEIKTKEFQSRLSYISIKGADESGQGLLKDQVSQFLPARYPYREAFLVQMSYMFRIKRWEGLRASTRYLQGTSTDFNLWTTQLSYQWEERWSAGVQSQMVAVGDSKAALRTAYAPYENNDNVAVGLNYVF